MIFVLMLTQIALVLIAVNYAVNFFAWAGKKVIDLMSNKPNGEEVREQEPL